MTNRPAPPMNPRREPCSLVVAQAPPTLTIKSTKSAQSTYVVKTRDRNAPETLETCLHETRYSTSAQAQAAPA